MEENKEQKDKDKNIKQKKNLCEAVKSLYNIQKILSHLTINKKLDLIIYNKQFQNKIGINIEHYKKSGRYRIGKKDELGKEYLINKEILIYEGRLKNGIRNAFGKEYNDKGNLIFKGIFLKGKKWNGYLKEYYKNGYLKFEGEIITGIKNGKAKLYFNSDDIIMPDEKLKSFIYKKHSLSQKEINFYSELKSKYESSSINLTEILQKIKDFCNKNIIFEGEYINGKKSQGIIKNYNDEGELIFEYEYREDHIINGRGKEYKDNQLISECEYLNGVKNGHGKEYKDNKLIFEGEYSYGKRNGKGKEYENNTIIFEGEYSYGRKNGNGKEYDFNGDIIFNGKYCEGKRWNGKGKEYDLNKN